MEQNIHITDRTKAFAVRIMKACEFLDEKPGVCRTLSKQLLRSGTSIGANVREAQSAQSTKFRGFESPSLGTKVRKAGLKSPFYIRKKRIANCELRIVK
jgi:hypothetical protein